MHRAGLSDDQLRRVNEFADNLREGRDDYPVNDRTLELLEVLRALRSEKKDLEDSLYRARAAGAVGGAAPPPALPAGDGGTTAIIISGGAGGGGGGAGAGSSSSSSAADAGAALDVARERERLARERDGALSHVTRCVRGAASSN